VGDLAALLALTSHQSVVFGDRSILLAPWPKVISIMPTGETKPGEIVAAAAALLADDDDDAAHGVQEFGVAHRVRVPAVKLLTASAPLLRRGRLPDRRVLEVGPVDAAAIRDEERAPFEQQIARAVELHRMVLALVEIDPTPRLLGLLVLAKATRPGAMEAVRSLRKAGLALCLAGAAAQQDQDAIAGLGLDQAATGQQEPVLAIVAPGERPIPCAATTIRFGGRTRATDAGADIVIARDDPRTLVDLLQFARDFERRVRVAIAVANLPGIALLSMAFGFVPVSPLFVSITALAGIALAVVTPQALRMSSTIANEVDEE
jgi:cation transport ATPase